MPNLREWMKKTEAGGRIEKTVEYKDPENGKKVEVTFEVVILSGIDKELIENEMFSGDTNSTASRFKKELMRRSLGLSQKEMDELLRIKPSVAIEQIEDACLKVNSSKYYVDPDEVTKVKNLEEREPSVTD